MGFVYSRVVGGKVVHSTSPRGLTEYVTSNTCAICRRKFTFSRRKRAPLYCRQACRKAGRLAALRRGGKPYIGPGGYRYILTERGWRAEHEVVMELALGRALLPGEHVSHKDRDRSNNAPANLALRYERNSARPDYFVGETYNEIRQERYRQMWERRRARD